MPSIRRSIIGRDIEIFRALDKTPLTPAQILALSTTWTEPFTTLRRAQRRLHDLAASGQLRSWLYSSTGRGRNPTYYKLTPSGYRFIHGDDAPLPHQRHFAEVKLSRQLHVRKLSDFIVHTFVSAHRQGISISGFCGDHTVRVNVAGETLIPDAAFQLMLRSGQSFNFVVELDNSTESILSSDARNSWERTIFLNQTHQHATGSRYRLLAVTTQSRERVTNILAAARQLATDPNRKLVYAAYLPDFLDDPRGVAGMAFRNHDGAPISLVADHAAATHALTA